MMRSMWGDHERFVSTYFSAFKGYYFTGDGARRDDDGYYWITGRVDDLMNVREPEENGEFIEKKIAGFFFGKMPIFLWKYFFGI